MLRLFRFACAYLVLLTALFSFSVSRNELRNVGADVFSNQDPFRDASFATEAGLVSIGNEFGNRDPADLVLAYRESR